MSSFRTGRRNRSIWGLSVWLGPGFMAALVAIYAQPSNSDEALVLGPDFVSPNAPADLNSNGGGAPAATLEQAAVFAWRQFIALNWPAAGRRRDTPADAPFDAADRPTRVWETFRGRVEIFPGSGAPFDSAKDDYQYDAPPRYHYDPREVGTYEGLPAGAVPSCSGAGGGPAPWNNLDEPNHNNVRAGVAPEGPFPGQQILIESKANRSQYVYVVSRGWYGAKSIRRPRKHTGKFVRTHLRAPPPPKLTDDPDDTELISFPVGTMEIKVAWRRLGEHDAGARFHVNRVRYYREQADGKPCYIDSAIAPDDPDRWGMVAMHFMRKTRSAPYFIWATFEQVDNLVLGKTDADGRAVTVETPDGRLTAAGGGVAAPYSPTVKVVHATPETPQELVFGSERPADMPDTRLYYLRDGGAPVAINKRIHPIPDGIARVNRVAMAAIKLAAPASPIQHYRLVSVQWRPIDKTPGVDYDGPEDPAIYYAANVIIEGRPVGQKFSGQFTQGFEEASDYLHRTLIFLNPRPNPGDPVFLNTFHDGKGYLSGGCMGCHGNRQVYGTDWSFLLHRQRVRAPEIKP